MLNFNLLVLGGLGFAIILGSLIDVIIGMGGSGRIFTLILLFSIIIAGVLLSKSSYEIMHNCLPQINKIFHVLLTLVFVVMQILVVFVITTLIDLYVVAPIMIKFGFQVTMP